MANGAKVRGRRERIVPYTVFTDPELGRVGLAEREAKTRGVAYELAQIPLANVARAIEMGETAGLMKILIDPKTEAILGAALLGPRAGELVHVLVALMQAGVTARAIVDAEMVHPTFAEGLQAALLGSPRFALSP
jgi:pyruvate/2-oxoglutarate dehydrogenase complex dihydrolipoamide dehydrogenase (E3) component